MKLICLMTLAAATFIAGTTFAISDTPVSPTEAEKIKTSLEAFGCTADEMEKRARAACASIRPPIPWLGVHPVEPVAADVLRLRYLLHRHPRSRHAGIAPLVASVVLAVGHGIFGPIRVVLQDRDGADRLRAGRKRHNHRSPVAVAHQAGAHLIPAAHCTARRNAGVVGIQRTEQRTCG
jgi:hypothetical protein